MKFSITLFAILSVAFMTTSCVEYHPYDTRYDGEKDVNRLNIARIESACAGKRTIKFAVISDTQRWYDETEEAVKALNRRNDIDFVMHTGDLADFGMKNEFVRQHDILNRLRVPYVVIIGNHDCLATGQFIYKEMFGDFNFAFTAGDVRFICLNTNALEFDHTESVPNFEFIEDEFENFPENASKSVIAMHAKPYTEQFDNGVARLFQAHVKAFPGLQFCVNGHGHTYHEDDLFGDGVIYYECENVAKRSYLLFTITENGYEEEKVEF